MFMNDDVMREYRFFPMDDAFITDKNVNIELYALIQNYAFYTSTANGYMYGKHQLIAYLNQTPGCEELARLMGHRHIYNNKTEKYELDRPAISRVEKDLKYLLDASKTNTNRPYIIKRMDDWGQEEIYQFNLNFNKTNALFIKQDVVDLIIDTFQGEDLLRLYIVLLKQYLKEGSSFIFTYDKLIELLGGYRPKIRKFNMPTYLKDLKEYHLIDFIALTDDAQDVASYQLLNVAQSLPKEEPAPMTFIIKLELNADGTLKGYWIQEDKKEKEPDEVYDYDVPEPGMLDLLGIEIDMSKVIENPYNHMD